ncbi:MAG: RDD family protein [Chthoniobacteraceae bacterium]
MNWYYAAGEQQLGPVSEVEFENLVKAGTISPETMVWRESMPAWKPYREISGGGTSTSSGTTCAECGTPTPADGLIYLDGRPICAACKPLALQKIKEGVSLPGQFVYGGFWIRFAAKILDGIIMWIVNMAIMFIVGILIGVVVGVSHAGQQASGSVNSIQLLIGIITLLVELAVGIGYVVFFVGKYGATPGKMACGLKIIRPDGSPLTYGRAFIRWLAELINGFTIGIGYLIAAFDEEKRGLHDRIADTRVVRK